MNRELGPMVPALSLRQADGQVGRYMWGHLGRQAGREPALNTQKSSGFLRKGILSINCKKGIGEFRASRKFSGKPSISNVGKLLKLTIGIESGLSWIWGGNNNGGAGYGRPAINRLI